MRHLFALLFLAPALALAQAPSRVASTLSGLLAMKPGETQPHVQVLGFSSPGDWGPPKTFRYDATNALATNAIRRATAIGSGRWVHDWDGDIRAFGAFTTSMTPALSNAIVASQALGIRLNTGFPVDLVFANTTERDALPTFLRTEGMLVTVTGNPSVTYKLEPGLTSWTQIPNVSVDQWDDALSEEAKADLLKKLDAYVVPLTVRQSTRDVLAGFVRPSDAFDPVAATHMTNQVMRAFPISFGSVPVQALLIERAGTNAVQSGVPEGQLLTVRTTVSTQALAGPFGMGIQALAHTDTTETNSHYVYYGSGANTPGEPVHFGALFRPNNPTNLTYTIRLGPATNLAWGVNMNGTLTGESLLPTTTFTTDGPMTLHDGGYVRLQNNWYYGWLTVTMTNTTTARAGLAPGGFLTYVGNSSRPEFYLGGYNYNGTLDAFETPIYPESKTNLTLILSKQADTYEFTAQTPFKTTDGSLLFWLRNGYKQPTNVVVFESSPNGYLKVTMSRSNIIVRAQDTAGSMSFTSSVPALTAFGERLLTLTWTTNNMRLFVDGGLIGVSAAPVGSFVFDRSGVVGRSLANTDYVNGHVAAAYVGTALSDTEVGYLPSLVGPSSALSTFKPLEDRTGTEGATAAIPLDEVVWSPRFMGDGEYPYVATNKAKEFHATASLWVYFATNDTRVSGLRAVTPIVGGAIAPERPTQDASALMVDFVTGQSIKPSWYDFPGQWHGCVNRPGYSNAIVRYLDAYASLGITILQHDDPASQHERALPFLSYRYGTGNINGTLSSPSRGCFCTDCQALASAIGYGTLTTNNLRGFHTYSNTNYWQWFGALARSKGISPTANLGPNSLIEDLAYTSGRFDYPYIEVGAADTYGDAMLSAWTQFRGRLIGTYAVNTQASYEQVFGSSDRTRRWMAAYYAMGFLPTLPWDVYAGTGTPRVFAARQDVVDLSGFVRAKGEHLFRGYSLASGIGETTSIPSGETVLAWASTNQVLVTVRYRQEDGRRVIHAVDLRDTPAPFTLSWWSPVVRGDTATVYKPATYDLLTQNTAVALGDFLQLFQQSAATVSKSNSVASISLDAGLWRVIEVSK